MAVPNKNIIDVFKKYALKLFIDQQTAMVDEDWKTASTLQYKYNTAIKTIGLLYNSEQITNPEKQLGHIKGIGKKTIKRINDIIKTGTLDELSNFEPQKELYDMIDKSLETSRINTTNNKPKQQKTYNKKDIKLLDLIGIGLKKAKMLGISNIYELKEKVDNGEITDKKVLLGLKYSEILQTTIPRKCIDDIQKLLLKTIKKIFNNQNENNGELPQLTICGSYRRGRTTSSDIDVIFQHSNISLFKIFINELTNMSFLLDTLTPKYQTKYNGFCDLSFVGCDKVARIDIMYTNPLNAGAALLYFTGPVELNVFMREKAKSMGYKLNEYYLKDISTNEIVASETEKDIFNALEMDYLTPKQREEYANKPQHIVS